MFPFIPPYKLLTIQEQHEYQHRYNTASLRLKKWYEAEPNQSRKVLVLDMYLDARASYQLLCSDIPITPQTAEKIHHLLMHALYKHYNVPPSKLRGEPNEER